MSRKSGIPLSSFPLKNEDPALLLRRIYAYLIRHRLFKPIDVDNLQPISPQPDAFERICIDENTKRTLRSAVHGHFSRSGMRTELSSFASAVGGKRRGLVILIQGPPGTGKTATVETIAQAYNKPLSRLGGNVFNREMNDAAVMFELAKAWDCPLLLDEADVFLSKEAKQDSNFNHQVIGMYRALSQHPVLTKCQNFSVF